MTKRVYAVVGTVFVVLGAFYPGTGSADQIPLFSAYPKVDVSHWIVSDGWTNGDHQSCEWRATDLFGDHEKLQLRLSDDGGNIRPIGCAEMHTRKKTNYGLYAVRLRSAAGSGLNTAFFTYAGLPTGASEHDEIDFEFLGKDPRTVSITHYANGRNVKGTVVQLGFDASASFHEYAFDWQPAKIIWFVDGKKVYETAEGDPIPSHDTSLYLSLWSGAGGESDWMGVFHYQQPISAEVEWVKFTPRG